MNIKNIPVKVLKLIVNIVFMLFSISCIFPILWMVNSALKTSNEFMQDSISLTRSLYVQNFIDAVQSSGFLFFEFRLIRSDKCSFDGGMCPGNRVFYFQI